MASLTPSPKLQLFTANGTPLVGGKLYTYAAGTTSPLATYTDSSGTSANPNPIILDSRGEASVWLDATSYKLRLVSDTDVEIWTVDNIAGAGLANQQLVNEIAATYAASNGSSLVGYLPAGTGAVATTVQAKLRESVSVKDFGVIGDGVTDDTAALKAVFDYAIPLRIPVELEGNFLVTGSIQPYVFRNSGEAHIVCRGNVTITVSAGATGFRDLFYLETTAANSCSITGGSLSINCNNKAASGITFRHNAASQSGTVNITCPVEVLNCFNTDAGATYENQAILVFGDYETVTINQPRVVGVSRTASGGACKGVAVAGFTGFVSINEPYVANILTGGGTVDADGIATFAKQTGTTNNTRPGRVVINEPVFVDCQGRSYKSQCSDSTVIRPKVSRQSYVSITQGVEFDFQFGNGLVLEPDYEYRRNGGVSPLGSSHSCIAFQQLLDDAPMYGKSVGGVLKTEVLVPRYAIAFHQSGSLYSETEVADLRVIAIGGLTTKAIDRAILEADMSTVVAKTAKTKLVVRNVSGPLQCYGVGYTSYTSGSLAAKLSWEVTGCYNTLPITSGSRPFHSLSGSILTEVEAFLTRDNHGFRDLYGNSWTFNFNKLVPGCKFTVDIGGVVATGAPGWGSSGYAVIECLSCWFSDTDKMVRVTKGNADVANTVFYTQSGGSTWGTIK
jgi:hypothetical protein